MRLQVRTGFDAGTGLAFNRDGELRFPPSVSYIQDLFFPFPRLSGTHVYTPVDHNVISQHQGFTDSQSHWVVAAAARGKCNHQALAR